jgi:hypothetical protein
MSVKERRGGRALTSKRALASDRFLWSENVPTTYIEI